MAVLKDYIKIKWENVYKAFITVWFTVKCSKNDSKNKMNLNKQGFLKRMWFGPIFC